MKEAVDTRIRKYQKPLIQEAEVSSLCVNVDEVALYSKDDLPTEAIQ